MEKSRLDLMLGIPYLEGQASPLGCDCLGFVSLALNIDIKRAYGMRLEEGIQLLSEIGFSESDAGELVLMKFNGSAWHLGLVGGDYIYHASKHRGKVVKDTFESFNIFVYKRFYRHVV